MAGTKTFLSGLTIGAGLVYFLDPERGGVRRDRFARAMSPLVGDLKNALEGRWGTPASALFHYGSRVGDLRGLEEATLLPSRGSPIGNAGEGVVRIAGVLLALYGVFRRGALGTVLRTVGTGVAIRTGAGGLPGFTSVDRRRAVDIQKTLHIEAPVEQVYAFWSNYENFPLFMSHVQEVEDMGGGRSHWKVRGPGGLPIEWNAHLSQQVPNEVIAWRSEAGSMLENAGVIRFSPSGSGTRVDLRFCYHPPAGGAGQAVAELLGSDPRDKLNQDLGRMKALLEATTRTESHGKEPEP